MQGSRTRRSIFKVIDLEEGLFCGLEMRSQDALCW